MSTREDWEREAHETAREMLHVSTEEHDGDDLIDTLCWERQMGGEAR